MKTQIQSLCTSPTAVWTAQLLVSSSLFTLTELLLMLLGETLLDLVLFVLKVWKKSQQKRKVFQKREKLQLKLLGSQERPLRMKIKTMNPN